MQHTWAGSHPNTNPWNGKHDLPEDMQSFK